MFTTTPTGETAARLNHAVEVLTKAREACFDDADEFFDFLAHALAGAAANVGGIDQLLGTHTTSRLQDCITTAAAGTPTKKLEELRTRPLVVPLNVAQLVEVNGASNGCLTYEEAMDELRTPDPDDYDDPEEHQAAVRAVQTERARIQHAFQAEYARYGEEFTEEVCRLAHTLPELRASNGEADLDRTTLRIPVSTTVQADPTACWDPCINNPQQTDGIAYRLWQGAYARLGLPQVERPASLAAQPPLQLI